MPNKFLLFLAQMIFLCASASAKEVTIEGVYQYILPPTMNEAEGKEVALNRAIIQALANEFGTIVTSEAWTDIKNDNSESSLSFWQMGNSFVKGEWLGPISEPVFRKYLSDDGDLVIEVKVKGKAREIQTSPIKLKTFLSLPSSGLENNRFKSGSRFTLYFTAPVSGYLSVYLADETGNVIRLLPYSQEQESHVPVEAMKEYEFFTSQDGFQEQYTFETDKAKERNIVYVLFSTNKYIRPLDSFDKDSTLRILKYKDFIKWTSELRSIDKSFNLSTLPVEIISTD